MSQWIGAPLPRKEDRRMLLGRGRFTADLDPKSRSGLLHAAFVRNPHAHARVGAVDTGAALKADGVAAVLTAASLGHPYLLAMLEREEFVPTRMPILAGETARFTGEPVDRQENLTAAFHGHEQRYRVRAAFDADGAILALDAEIDCDTGAYSVFPFTCAVEPLMAATELPGVYKVPAYRARGRAIATNKAPAAPYRGVHPDQVRLRQGDTDLASYGWGTWGSRSIVIGGGAAGRAADLVAGQLKHVAAQLLEASPADVELAEGTARIRGDAGAAIPIAELARVVHFQAHRLTEDLRYGLEARATFDPPGTFSNACHAAKMCDIDVVHLQTPSRFSETGAKGMGEGGTIGAPAAVLGAINDAVAALGVSFDHIPVLPQDLIAALGGIS
ncbi:MAG TPA: xanthine dehydrogenase family protein [Streptosporangiaceae bacterium]|nr:xanthine dehydrogenase family protein [Streptosporangiaceae bacterium]